MTDVPTARNPSTGRTGRSSRPTTATVVAPDVYDETYYAEVCAGGPEWMASAGQSFRGLYDGYAERIGIGAADVVVDIGTGRGEMIAVAARRGARAVGVEYAPAALAFCRESLRSPGVDGRALAVAADARSIPVASRSATVVTMLDVVEHLAPAELDAALGEARRVLRPGGRLIVHTMPTPTIYDVTYRLQRLRSPGRLRRWPADPRNDHERSMHVNEQTRRRLRRSLVNAGFAHVQVRRGQWIHTDFVPDPRARALYHRLARFRLTAALGIADLWAEAHVERRPQ